MSPEEQRIAITEACGWTETEAWLNGRRCFEHADSNAGWDFDSLPDYLNDLNAIHEAEKILDKSPDIHELGVGICSAIEVYEDILLSICDHPIRATADQRCEAFLRTIDKWKE